MNCYICAYRKSNLPGTYMPLPVGSPVGIHDPIGTCVDCGVWACSDHGTRYAGFECAICVPAVAVAAAMTGAGPNAATGAAKSTRAATDPELVASAKVVVARIVADMNGSGYSGMGVPRANVVTDLEGAINAQMDSEPSTLADRVDPAVVGAAVRSRLGGLRAEAGSEAPGIIAGAVALAYRLADGVEITEEVKNLAQLPQPWLVKSPILLDPLIWMVVVAARED